MTMVPPTHSPTISRHDHMEENDSYDPRVDAVQKVMKDSRRESARMEYLKGGEGRKGVRRRS